VGLIAVPLLFGPAWIIHVGLVLSFLIYLAAPPLPSPIAFPDQSWLVSHVSAANQIYGSAGFSEILAFRVREVSAFMALHALIFPRTLGLFMVGMVVWRSGLVRSAKQHSLCLWIAGTLLTTAGLIFTLATSARWYSEWSYIGPADPLVARLSTIIQPLGYGCLVLAASTLGQGRWLVWLEPLGRMAFTNYIVQSLLLGWIFYGYGLGLFGKIGSAAGMTLVVVIYVGQCLCSRWWLRYFRYGPIEDVWRAIMYGRWPVFRPE
jgi:uncharacterized protein